MRAFRLIPCCLLMILLACLPVARAQTNDTVEAPPVEEPAPPTDVIDAVDAAIAEVNKQDNGVTINREDLSIDIETKVCLREAEFLEMLACTKDTREHESILVMEAAPSTIHLGLLLLGQEPGEPLNYDLDFDPPKLIPATGPEVQIFIVREIAGQERETPANRWVQDNKTGEMMKDNTWLFAGSAQTEINGKPVYLADVNGSAVSLVNFGDDLLTLPGDLTHENESHGKAWAPRTRAIPEVGTKVTLRLRVEAPKDEPAGDKPEEPSTGPPSNQP